jgi:hypothetical protein
MEEDSIIQFLTEEINNNVHVTDQDELILMLNFLGTMALGCRRLKLKDISSAYSNRLNMFVILLQKLGYKSKSRTKSSSLSGLQSLISKAFYNLRVF